ncbi:dual specificity protein phosphatase, putative [Entamoeba invadens IP1]|uniref:Dual specificity protein phosphatase, putative n=1 Tax=Entamoeba invadens IP1 TaxID=370355 RepID=L7FPC2_ENTIV|nr:dual specificity protein phosphatase, putative [Entamoeba invadens IP1]ELP94682.1 dual specificity protein phosphatase, putative [Entamoeba invadens IP1]|eukprot:XP_004261453.1 dual specificity protein phosphatase, putative [Entamoeba invadens IP1]
MDFNLLSTLQVDKDWKNLKTISLTGNDLSSSVIECLQMKLSVSTYEADEVSEIEHGIYLGSLANASDQFLLARLEIKWILSVCDVVPFYQRKYRYKTINVLDMPETNILEYFDEGTSFLEEAQKKGENVLVHCMAGVSRSASIIVAYIMKTKKLSRDQAITYVRTKRPIIQPNNGFMSQLYQYQMILENIENEKKCHNEKVTIKEVKTSNKGEKKEDCQLV